MNVAVLGGGGFLGYHAVAALQAAGHAVRIHRDPSQFAITDEAAIADFIRNADIVVHLAGPPSVAESFERRAEFVNDHTRGTAVVLDAMRGCEVRRIVYVSSAEVYGNVPDHPVSETQPFAPRSPYGAAKAGAEHLLRAAWYAGEISGTVLRPFSIYGPGIRENSLLGTMIGQAQRGDVIAVNDARPVRDYVYVTDVADAIALAASRSQADYNALNVCSGTGTSIPAIVSALENVFSRPLTLLDRGAHRGSAEIFALRGDPRAAEAILGWRATTTLEDGLGETAAALAKA